MTLNCKAPSTSWGLPCAAAASGTASRRRAEPPTKQGAQRQARFGEPQAALVLAVVQARARSAASSPSRQTSSRITSTSQTRTCDGTPS
ncbi:hypothetical protein LP419_23745 [Massilia sp. H-1]|nr:hypothetical protein LP419_23745 [Massilia sp. H-1]